MQNQNNSAFPLMISIVVMDAAQLASVYALLGGTAIALVPGKQQQRVVQPDDNAQERPTGADQGGADEQPARSAVAEVSPPATDGEIDAHGHPWSDELHASTKTKTKDGLWRMKVGVTRPDPLPGFPVESPAATGTQSETPPPSATSPAATEPASAPAATSGDDDDEFAAFRAAAATSDAADAAAAAAVPERQYSDADLGALCNQAAVKLGDPNPIKEIIASLVPTGEVAHSRNIPADKRAEFVKAVEAKAGIEFAG